MGALVAVRTRSVPWADWRRSSNVRTQRIVHIAAAFNSTWARGRWVRLRPERAQKLPYRFPVDEGIARGTGNQVHTRRVTERVFSDRSRGFHPSRLRNRPRACLL